MYEGLKPCPHRTVDSGGRILCGLIKTGDQEVSVNLCRACPVPQINCQHLRAAIQKRTSTPITVRYATGRVEVWDDEVPSVGFKQAACAVKTMPIHSPRDCSGCPLRLAYAIPQTAIQVARQAKHLRSGEASAPQATVMAADRRAQPITSSIVAEIPAKSEKQESDVAREMVQRAQAIALRNSGQRAPQAPSSGGARTDTKGRTETRSKIILLQQWLAEQVNKKESGTKGTASPVTNEDGIQEIVYTPIAPVYQEEAGYERCVGWTD